jgi:hypothetical protein
LVVVLMFASCLLMPVCSWPHHIGRQDFSCCDCAAEGQERLKLDWRDAFFVWIAK